MVLQALLPLFAAASVMAGFSGQQSRRLAAEEQKKRETQQKALLSLAGKLSSEGDVDALEGIKQPLAKIIGKEAFEALLSSTISNPSGIVSRALGTQKALIPGAATEPGGEPQPSIDAITGGFERGLGRAAPIEAGIVPGAGRAAQGPNIQDIINRTQITRAPGGTTTTTAAPASLAGKTKDTTKRDTQAFFSQAFAQPDSTMKSATEAAVKAGVVIDAQVAQRFGSMFARRDFPQLVAEGKARGLPSREAQSEAVLGLAERHGSVPSDLLRFLPKESDKVLRFLQFLPEETRSELLSMLKVSDITQIKPEMLTPQILAKAQKRAREVLAERQSGVQSKEFTALRESEIGARNVVGTANELISLVQGNPEILSSPGALARFGDSLASQAEGLGRLLGIDIQASRDPKDYQDVLQRLRIKGLESAQAQSLIVDLAYATAISNDRRGRVSDQDLKAAIRQIGASTGSPDTFIAVLESIKKQAVAKFQNRFRVVRRGDPVPDIPLGGAPPPTEGPTLEYNVDTGKLEPIR